MTYAELSKMKAKILVMLAKAESSEFPEERDLFNAGAEKLMIRLGITAAELEAAGEVQAEKVIEVNRTYPGEYSIAMLPLVNSVAHGFGHITILQGQGTALYTPLEQYGGDSGHTDGRSDIYSFGATLYHLLTNTAPLDARDRFLHPDELVPPRQINPEITPRTERAILWAMSLHPDERPESVDRFRQSLLGDTPVVPRPASSTRPVTLRDVFRSSQERLLLGAVVALTLFSLFFTLMR